MPERATDLASIAFDPIPSFLGARIATPDEVTAGTVAMVGYFCDNLAGGTGGERFLSRQIRYFSGASKPRTDLCDVGDLKVFPLEPMKHRAAVTAQCSALLRAHALPILIGGDASGLACLELALRAFDPSARTVALPHLGTACAEPVLCAINLGLLEPGLRSRPTRLHGATLGSIVDAISAMPQRPAAAAIYGLAPALDICGANETRAAVAVLRALANRMTGEA